MENCSTDHAELGTWGSPEADCGLYKAFMQSYLVAENIFLFCRFRTLENV